MQIGRYAPRLRNQNCELVALSSLSTPVKKASSPIITLGQVWAEDAAGKPKLCPIRFGADIHRAFNTAPSGELGSGITLSKVLSLWPSGSTLFVSIAHSAREISPFEFRSAIENLARQYRCQLVPVFPVSEVAALAEPSHFPAAGPIAVEFTHAEARHIALGRSVSTRDQLKRLATAPASIVAIVDFAETAEAHRLDATSTIEWLRKFLADTGLRRVIVAGNSITRLKKSQAFRPVAVPRHDKRLFDLLKKVFPGHIVARSDWTCVAPDFNERRFPLRKFRAFIRGIQAGSHVIVPGVSTDAEGRIRQFPVLIEAYLKYVDPKSRLDCVGLQKYLKKSIRTPKQALAAAMVIYMTHGAAEHHPLGLLGQPLASQAGASTDERVSPMDQPSLPFESPEDT